MLRECPLDHRCMRGVDVGGGARRRAKDAVTAGGLPRPRRHDDRRRRLPRRDRAASRSFRGRSTPIRALNRAGLAVVVVTNQSGDRARLLHRSVRRGGAPPHRGAASRPAARASTRITIVRTIPTAASAVTRGRATAGSRRRGLIDRAARGSRPRSGAVVRRRRQVDRRAAGARAVGARAILVRTGIRRRRGARPPAGLAADVGRRQSRRGGELDLGNSQSAT